MGPPPPLEHFAPPGPLPLAAPIEPPPIVIPPPREGEAPIAIDFPDQWQRRPKQRTSVFKRALIAIAAKWNALRRAAAAHHAQHPNGALARLLEVTPAWLVSLVVHLSLMLLIGLAAVEVHRQDEHEAMSIALETPEDFKDEVFAETLGEQLETPVPGATLDDLEQGVDPTYSISALPEVEDPLAAPPKSLELFPDGSAFLSDIEAPSIGMALSGRQEGRKQALMDAYGGTMTTQESVVLALTWLGRQQGRDGAWRLDGPYPNGANAQNKVAATAMALLAYLGDGHTHLADGPFRRNVQRGVTALLKLQNADGEFVADSPTSHKLYSQAQATIALCELYGLTEDSHIREAAERAVDYCVKIQSPQGGWRYMPRQDADTSVTGWFVMALQSARMAKLDVPSESLERVGSFLDSVASSGGSRYAYTPGQPASEAMTAEALLCRQYLGWSRTDTRLAKGVAYLGNHPVDWQSRNVYYWYYGTQVMHHMGSQPWVKWNRVMRQTIPENQVRNGRDRGSWDPGDDQWGGAAGRLYVTCLSTYMLEVYYRHLPLYASATLAEQALNSSQPSGDRVQRPR